MGTPLLIIILKSVTNIGLKILKTKKTPTNLIVMGKRKKPYAHPIT